MMEYYGIREKTNRNWKLELGNEGVAKRMSIKV